MCIATKKILNLWKVCNVQSLRYNRITSALTPTVDFLLFFLFLLMFTYATRKKCLRLEYTFIIPCQMYFITEVRF